MVSIFFTNCTFWVPGGSIFDVSGTLGGIGMLAVRKGVFLLDFWLVLGCQWEALSATWAPLFAPKRLSGAMGCDSEGDFSGSVCFAGGGAWFLTKTSSTGSAPCAFGSAWRGPNALRRFREALRQTLRKVIPGAPFWGPFWRVWGMFPSRRQTFPENDAQAEHCGARWLFRRFSVDFCLPAGTPNRDTAAQ